VGWWWWAGKKNKKRRQSTVCEKKKKKKDVVAYIPQVNSLGTCVGRYIYDMYMLLSLCVHALKGKRKKEKKNVFFFFIIIIFFFFFFLPWINSMVDMLNAYAGQARKKRKRKKKVTGDRRRSR
jgi:hypothetical protein